MSSMKNAAATAASGPGSADRAAGSPRRTRKEVAVFTRDDEFLLALGPSLDDRYRSRPSDGRDEWETSLRGRRGVALVDAASIGEAADLVRRLESQCPDFSIVVFASAARSDEWKSALSRGAIARVFERESATATQFAEALESGSRAAADSADRPHAAQNVPGDAGGTGGSRSLLIAGAAIAAVLVAAGAWYALSGKTPESAPAAPVADPATASASQATPEPAAPAMPQTASVPELLSAARMAFSEQRYVEPANNNALDLYTRVLAAEPGNAEAEDGVSRVISVASTLLEAEIRSGKLDEATSLLARLRAVAPDDPMLTAYEQELASAKPRWLATRAREALGDDQVALAERLTEELAATGAERATVQELRRAIDAKRKDGEIGKAVAEARSALTPALLLDGSANGPRAKLTQLQQLDRRNPQVVAFQRDYQSALVKRGREATGTGAYDEADRYLSAAAELGGGRDLEAARKELAAAREERTRAASAPAPATNRTSAAAAASAPQQAAPAAAGPAKMPKVKRRTAPEYPVGARRDGIEGFVMVEFGLTAEGRTSDIVVRAATPPGVFDKAAMNAVKNWRFESVTPEEAARLPRSVVKLTFELGDE